MLEINSATLLEVFCPKFSKFASFNFFVLFKLRNQICRTILLENIIVLSVSGNKFAGCKYVFNMYSHSIIKHLYAVNTEKAVKIPETVICGKHIY